MKQLTALCILLMTLPNVLANQRSPSEFEFKVKGPWSSNSAKLRAIHDGFRYDYANLRYRQFRQKYDPLFTALVKHLEKPDTVLTPEDMIRLLSFDEVGYYYIDELAKKKIIGQKIKKFDANQDYQLARLAVLCRFSFFREREQLIEEIIQIQPQDDDFRARYLLEQAEFSFLTLGKSTEPMGRHLAALKKTLRSNPSSRRVILAVRFAEVNNCRIIGDRPSLEKAMNAFYAEKERMNNYVGFWQLFQTINGYRKKNGMVPWAAIPHPYDLE